VNKENKTVAVLGASSKPDRYSYQCVELLLQHGYNVVPVTPAKQQICGIEPTSDLSSISDKVDTLTMYVNPKRSSDMEEDILNLNPKRIIFNPGSENADLEEKCIAQGIRIENACTLVLLNTEQF
jgi:predicted CoA-binding protein